jgi:hypothetical protein
MTLHQYITQVFQNERKEWLEYLRYTEEHVMRDSCDNQYIFLDGFKVYVPEELTSISQFKKKLNQND